MSDFESRIREEFVAMDPLPPGAEGDWHDVVGRAEGPRPRRRWALAVAAVTAVAAAVIAVLVLLPAGGGGPSNAAAALNRLANLVATQSLTPQPGQYLYIRSKSEWGAFSGSCETRSIEHNEIWIGTDGSGLDRDTDERGHFTSAADRATSTEYFSRVRNPLSADASMASSSTTRIEAPCVSMPFLTPPPAPSAVRRTKENPHRAWCLRPADFQV